MMFSDVVLFIGGPKSSMSVVRYYPAALLTVVATLLMSATPSPAQDLFIYPAKGQTQEQQDKDRYECHSWAVQQTGFDPSKPSTTYSSAPATTTQPQGGVLKGATKGAVVGVVGGAIGGNAGKGAAIGAVSGGLIGGMRRNDQIRQQQYQAAQQQQQAANADAAQRQNYNRAMGACLQGRGYSVD